MLRIYIACLICRPQNTVLTYKVEVYTCTSACITYAARVFFAQYYNTICFPEWDTLLCTQLFQERYLLVLYVAVHMYCGDTLERLRYIGIHNKINLTYGVITLFVMLHAHRMVYVERFSRCLLNVR